LLSTEEQSFAEISNMPITDIDKVGMWEVETTPMAWYDSTGGKLIDIRKIIDPSKKFDDELK
jgi:hypothetical protein